MVSTVTGSGAIMKWSTAMTLSLLEYRLTVLIVRISHADEIQCLI